MNCIEKSQFGAKTQLLKHSLLQTKEQWELIKPLP